MELNEEKGISLVVFFLVTILPGLVPIFLFSRCQKRMKSRTGQTVVTLLKCFSGGVFLATAFLSLLVAGSHEFEKFREEASFDSSYPFFHLGIGVGFFLVAFMERFAIFLSGGHTHKHSTHTETGDVKMESVDVKPQTFKEKGAEVSDTCTGANDVSTGVINVGMVYDVNSDVSKKNGGKRCENLSDSVSGSERHQPKVVDAEITIHSDDAHDDPDHDVEQTTGPSGMRAIVVLLALSFHSLFDGLAVGLQDKQSRVWAITIAVSTHKVIMVLSLSLELSMTLPGRPFKTAFLIFLFAIMAPIGVGIGIGVTSGNLNTQAQLLAGSVLQAVATGSFLYVTFFEILSEQLGHDSSMPKIGVTMLGFALMAVAKMWDTN